MIRCVERGSNERSEEHDHAEACSREGSDGAVCGRHDAVQSTALAQSATQTCKPAQVIPLTGTEPAAKLVIEPPLAEPLASRGVVVIPYCAENMHIAPVFGPGALAVSPRVGHIHVTVDEAPWRWADTSGNPVILQGLPPGPHKVLIELVDANHQPVDQGTVTFDVPKKAAAGADSERRR